MSALMENKVRNLAFVHLTWPREDFSGNKLQTMYGHETNSVE